MHPSKTAGSPQPPTAGWFPGLHPVWQPDFAVLHKGKGFSLPSLLTPSPCWCQPGRSNRRDFVCRSHEGFFSKENRRRVFAGGFCYVSVYPKSVLFSAEAMSPPCNHVLSGAGTLKAKKKLSTFKAILTAVRIWP